MEATLHVMPGRSGKHRAEAFPHDDDGHKAFTTLTISDGDNAVKVFVYSIAEADAIAKAARQLQRAARKTFAR